MFLRFLNLLIRNILHSGPVSVDTTIQDRAEDFFKILLLNSYQFINGRGHRNDFLFRLSLLWYTESTVSEKHEYQSIEKYENKWNVQLSL